MSLFFRLSTLLLWALVGTSLLAEARPGFGQQSAPPPATAPAEAPGKEVLQRKCFQCHQIGMWSSLRQDRKAWEGVLYRMVGRGAIWTQTEVDAMADFLTQLRGPVK
jgi:hypothetical protein